MKLEASNNILYLKITVLFIFVRFAFFPALIGATCIRPNPSLPSFASADQNILSHPRELSLQESTMFVMLHDIVVMLAFDFDGFYKHKSGYKILSEITIIVQNVRQLFIQSNGNIGQ